MNMFRSTQPAMEPVTGAVHRDLFKWLGQLLDLVTRFVTSNDVVVDLATRGLVLKDTQATPHYWRVTVDNTGTLVTTDLGTERP